MTSVKLELKINTTSVWRLSCFDITRVFRNGTHLGEMVSDAFWVVSFGCVVKDRQECHFEVKEGEDFKVLKKIGEKGRAFSSEL